MKMKNVGFGKGFKPRYTDEEAQGDKNCPFFGTLPIRGKLFEGIVVSDKMPGTVKVMWERVEKVKKYARYLRKRSVVLAHNPKSVQAKAGDRVIIGETRPLSKRKHFCVLKVIENESN